MRRVVASAGLPDRNACRMPYDSSTSAVCSSISSRIASTPRQPQWSHMSADPIPAAAGAVAAELGVVAAAVDDVRAGQVADGCTEDVDEAGERPQREQPEGDEGVELEPQWCVGHQLGVGVEGEEGAVPDRDAFAVVVLPADVEDRAGDGVPHAQDDHGGEEGVHHLVHRRGGGEDGADGAAAVDQDGHADDGHQAGDEAAGDGNHVIGVVADPQSIGPRLRHQQTDQVAPDDTQHPEVEQRAPDAQQPVLVQLGGPGGPSELVVAVPPPVTDHEGGQAQVGHDDEEELVHRRAPGKDGMGSSVVSGSPVEAAPGLNCGAANGASPTSSSGGPSAARRRTASRSSPSSGGKVAVTALISGAHGEPMSWSESRSSSRPARWSSIRSRPRIRSTVAAYSRTTQRWSGSSASSSSNPDAR